MAEDDVKLSPVVKEAMERFKLCAAWESDTRELFVEDVKFANADADNGWQWPDTLRQNRDTDDRPCLTINVTRQHNLKIINDGKKNKPGIKVSPTGGGATYDSAQVFGAVIRRIENKSNAQAAYDGAGVTQVTGGVGYWRIVTDYAGPDTFDQELFIKPIKNPLSVYYDMDCQQADYSDPKYCLIFDDIPLDEAKRRYAKYKDIFSDNALGNETGWMREDTVRVAEYFRLIEKTRKIASIVDPLTGERRIVKEEEIPPDLREMVLKADSTKVRTVVEKTVEWYLIIGTKIAEKSIWAGKYIPVIKIVGEETIVDGELDRKGHTRSMKDPQRMYNYWSSSAVEHVALQGKSPYIAPAQAIEEFEGYWNNANKQNFAVLPFNHLDDQGNAMQAPARAEAPQMAMAYISGMQLAREEVQMASGQFEASMGEQGNERTGKAITERQRSGETSTYHFIDNQALGIRFTGVQLIDLIPKIYDTSRVVQIMAEDGTTMEVQIDPQAKKAFEMKQMQVTNSVQRIFNPSVGEYEVTADVGPGYATKRQEAFNAIQLILTQAPEMAQMVGDLLFRSADFPFADEIAQRLRRMVPPQALGEGPTQQEQVLTDQVNQLSALLQETTHKMAEQSLKLKGKDELRDIDAYEAETNRLKVVVDQLANFSPEGFEAMMTQLVQQTLNTSLDPILTEITNRLNQGAMHPGPTIDQEGAPV